MSTPSRSAIQESVLRRGPRLPALDLAHVLLREPVARELRLGQARGDAQLSQRVSETRLRTLRRERCEGAAFHDAALPLSASVGPGGSLRE